eukprot:2491720-Prymnesium_polylepis.1
MRRVLLAAQGPLSGGTLVHIYGSGLHRGHGLRECRFAGQAVSASLLAHAALACVAPRSPMPGSAYLDLSLNGQDYFSGGNGSAMNFTYTQPLIHAVAPNTTTATGTTLVTIVGSGFSGGARYLCRFGGHDVPAWYDTLQGFVFCHAPSAALVVNASGTVGVELSLNGVDFTTAGHTFGYLPAPEILSVTPRSGP